MSSAEGRKFNIYLGLRKLLQEIVTFRLGRMTQDQLLNITQNGFLLLPGKGCSLGAKGCVLSFGDLVPVSHPLSGEV